jgi:hypothetical protein
MGRTALLPLRRKLCYGFLLALEIHRCRLGLNLRTLGPVPYDEHYTTEKDEAKVKKGIFVYLIQESIFQIIF